MPGVIPLWQCADVGFVRFVMRACGSMCWKPVAFFFNLPRAFNMCLVSLDGDPCRPSMRMTDMVGELFDFHDQVHSGLPDGDVHAIGKAGKEGSHNVRRARERWIAVCGQQP